ncbi:hypothetical protein KIPB_015221, partial [Kipferlia bialata]|eukprot:g15221.t1
MSGAVSVPFELSPLSICGTLTVTEVFLTAAEASALVESGDVWRHIYRPH